MPARGPSARCALWLAFPLLVFSLFGAAGRAASQTVSYLTPADPDALPLKVKVIQVLTELSDRSGYGYMILEVTSEDDEDHEVTARVYTLNDNTPFSAERTMMIPAGTQRSATLPLPGFANWLQCEVEIDGASWGITSMGFGSSSSLLVLAVGFARRDPRNAWEKARVTLRDQGIFDIEVSHIEPGDLPDRWSDLSAVDLLVINGRDPDLQTRHQQILADYVAGGGRLVSWSRDSLGPGRLRDLGVDPFRAPRKSALGHHGLGLWADGDDNPAVVATLLGSASAGNFAAALPAFAAEPVPIPGIGDIPVRAFVLLILAFVILVGPVNYIYFRRRKQTIKAFVVAPAVGLALTGAIIIYGLVGDGFGIRKSSYALTLLDQRAHEAYTAAQQTFYAGISPRDGLTPESGTLLLPASPDGLRAPLDLRLDDGLWIGGGALPSRTETAYTLITRKRVRARLRFRRLAAADGGYEVLPDAALVPLDGDDTLVLRDFAGRYHTRTEDGHLMPVVEATGVHTLRALLTGLEEARQAANHVASQRAVKPAVARTRSRRWHTHMTPTQTGLELLSWTVQRFGAVELPPGSYAAVVEASPGVDDLGINARTEAGYQIVIGALAKEDILD